MDARAALDDLIKSRGESYSAISLLLGRNPAYIQQYVKRGSPRRLEEQDRRTLAQYFRVAESTLGGDPHSTNVSADIVDVPRLNIEASAGAGSLVGEESAVGSLWFNKIWLRKVCQGKLDQLSVIRVVGDSMAPTLCNGDEVLVDPGVSSAFQKDGIHVITLENNLMIKRLSMSPTHKLVTISSDNTAYPAFRDCPSENIKIVGRVVWVGRTLS